MALSVIVSVFFSVVTVMYAPARKRTRPRVKCVHAPRGRRVDSSALKVNFCTVSSREWNANERHSEQP